MAKINARGATEVARWKNPKGATLVLASDGRLLWSAAAGDDYTLHLRFSVRGPQALVLAEGVAARAGYERV